MQFALHKITCVVALGRLSNLVWANPDNGEYADLQSKNAARAYLKSQQLLPLSIAVQNGTHWFPLTWFHMNEPNVRHARRPILI